MIDIDHHDTDYCFVEARIQNRISNIYTTKGTKCRRFNIVALQEPEKKRKQQQVCDAMNQVTE